MRVCLCLCVHVRAFLGFVLQINTGTAAGVSGLLRFQRGLPDTKRGHAGKPGLHILSGITAFVLCFFHCVGTLNKTLGGEEDFQEQDFPYSLFNLLTDEYQFTLLTHRHLCVCSYTPVHLRNNTLRWRQWNFFFFFCHVNVVKPLIA